MPTSQERLRIAVLDDYQNVALSMADWSVVEGRAAVTVFNDHLADTDAVVARLEPFDIVCVMRERTPMMVRSSRACQAPPDRFDGHGECHDRHEGGGGAGH